MLEFSMLVKYMVSFVELAFDFMGMWEKSVSTDLI